MADHRRSAAHHQYHFFKRFIDFGTGRLPPNTTLYGGRYLLLQTLGKGGMGAVYLARDTQRNNELVAIKEMSQGSLKDLGELQHAKQRFQQEADILRRLRHPHLPRVYDSFQDKKRSYLVMDYIRGKTLADMLKQARGAVLPIEQVVNYGLQLCDVLTYLHTYTPPIVFRDLKPSNILVQDDGQLFLIDFGIARFWQQTLDTEAFVTPGYAAPEQYGGLSTPRSDIFSLGATLHYCLTGRNPQANTQAHRWDFLPVDFFNAQTPRELCTLVEQMVQIRPGDRPANAREVQSRLRKIGMTLVNAVKLPRHETYDPSGITYQVSTPTRIARLEKPSASRERYSWRMPKNVLFLAQRLLPFALGKSMRQEYRESQETQGSVKLPPEQTEAFVNPSSPNTPQYDFYISYNKADRDRAMWVANYVQQAGYTFFFPPQDFRMGFIFKNELKKAFIQAKRMIVILSPAYIEALKSRTGGFSNFKRATIDKQDILLSICFDSNQSVSKKLSEIANHIDLTGENDVMIEALLRAYISGGSITLPTSETSQSSVNHPSVSNASTVPLEQSDHSNPILPPTKKHVVLLVHGIRTHGNWQEMVAAHLAQQDSIQVFPLRYGYFDSFRFWLPFLTRKKIIERVLRDIRTTLMAHRDSHLSIIAHSFGTYAITKILTDNPDIHIYRLILCGSVLNTNFRWDQLYQRIEGNQRGKIGIINECGTRDIWPILAQISTWGYGAAGSFGFGTPLVRDRSHDYHHGDYFSPQFVKDYWVPFIEQGQVISSKWDVERPVTPGWMSLLSLFPLRYIILLVLILPLLLAGLLIVHH